MAGLCLSFLDLALQRAARERRAKALAVATGKPQTYGTQIGCTTNGPKPSTPIKDAAHVEQRRAEAGLGTLTAYYRQMTKICAAD